MFLLGMFLFLTESIVLQLPSHPNKLFLLAALSSNVVRCTEMLFSQTDIYTIFNR